jgi:hypothetical protein
MHCSCLPQMTGVIVGGEFFAFHREEIDLSQKKLGEAALLPLLDSFSRGQFTNVQMLNLVIQ